MNAKVQEFIDKKKSELKEEELKKREEHLISLGLVDESKSVEGVVYFDIWDGSEECKWDEEKQRYVKRSYVPAPIEVTDEEYQEILKYAPKERTETGVKKEPDTTWGNAINTIANILLAINIIGGVTLCIILSNDYSTADFAWIPIVSALTYCILWYPLILGFSKIVKAAEKTLQE